MILRLLEADGHFFAFRIEEEHSNYVDIDYVSSSGETIFTETVFFHDGIFIWRKRSNLPQRAKDFCEKSVKSFLNMKVFW